MVHPVVSLTLIVIGPFQKVVLGQKLQFATPRNNTNQIRIRKRELDASNNRSFASEFVSSEYDLTALVLIVNKMRHSKHVDSGRENILLSWH